MLFPNASTGSLTPAVPPAPATPPPAVPKAEPPPAETPAPKASAEIAAVAKQRAANQAAADKLAADRAAFDAERASARPVKAFDAAEFVADPDGYLAALGLTEEERVGSAQHVFYSRMPDKAPPELAAKLLVKAETRKWQAKQDALDKATREATEAKEKAETDARNAQGRAALTAYAGKVQAQYTAPEAATKFPASKAFWDEDNDAYTQTLLATANNLAESWDPASGTPRPDLTPEGVAAFVEKEMATRFGRYKPTPPPAPAADPKTLARPPMQGTLSGSDHVGAADPGRKLTEAERLARAAQIPLFKTVP